MEKTLNDNLIFTDNNGSEKAVLGTLEGPCADIIDGSTREGPLQIQNIQLAQG